MIIAFSDWKDLCEYDAIDTDHNSKLLRSADHDRIQRCRERLDDKLVLKVGARVLLRRNMDIKGGWVSGNSDCDARELHSGQEDEQDHGTLPSPQAQAEV